MRTECIIDFLRLLPITFFPLHMTAGDVVLHHPSLLLTLLHLTSTLIVEAADLSTFLRESDFLMENMVTSRAIEMTIIHAVQGSKTCFSEQSSP